MNGQALSPAALIETLNEIAGRHGVGRVDMVENRLVGIKSRGVYETPGGTLLVQALRALETLTLDRDAMHEKERLALRYAELVYYGQWFNPLREALEAFVEKDHGDRHGPRHAEALQGLRHRRRPHRRGLALLRQPRVLQHDRLHAPGRRRLHPPLRAADARPQAAFAPPPPRRSRPASTCASSHGADAVKAKRLWGGRFAEAPAEVLRRFNDSFSFDRELLADDVRGSIAWAEELGRAGVLRPSEARTIVRGLSAVEAGWQAGAGDAAGDAGHEDVHSYVEAALARRSRAAVGKAPHRPLPERPGRDRPAALPQEGARRAGVGGARAGRGRSRSVRPRRPRRRCPATRT